MPTPFLLTNLIKQRIKVNPMGKSNRVRAERASKSLSAPVKIKTKKKAFQIFPNKTFFIKMNLRFNHILDILGRAEKKFVQFQLKI